MFKPVCLIIALTGSALAGCATTPDVTEPAATAVVENEQAPQPAAGGETAAVAETEVDVVRTKSVARGNCTKMYITGSRMPRRICMSKAEEDALHGAGMKSSRQDVTVFNVNSGPDPSTR